MGFFSDLKEDLSQAVNELMPEDEQTTEGTEQSKEEVSIADIDEMLQNIDSIKLPESAGTEQDKNVEPEAAEDIASNEQTEEETADVDLESMLEQALNAEIKEPEIQIEENAAEKNKGAEKKMETYASRTVSDETSVITAGMTITGDLTSEGSVDVIGSINGNIDVLGKLNVTGHINGNSKAAEIYAESAKINGEVVSAGSVKIGASSVIIGNITATSAAIAGAVKGDIDVKGPVILDASAIVMGNIKSKSVQINNGAVVEGMCSQCYADVSPTSFFDEYKPDIKKAKQK